jgi:hypothetical protein
MDATIIDSGGGGGGGALGGLWDDIRHLRADAKLAVQILSLGVVPEEQSAALLRKGFVLAAQATTARDYRAAMSVVTKVAEIEQKERLVRLDRPARRHEHIHEIGPVTLDNFAQRKAAIAQRIARLGGNAETA